MAIKSKQGQTEKYSGVVNSVKKTQEPEEPKITQEEVVKAFQSFGFILGDRSHDDVTYWITKGKSELPKLIEDLHKRRDEINKREDENKKAREEKEKNYRSLRDKQDIAQEELLHKQNITKMTMPRLSDEDIKALFDEYGLPVPPTEWVRSHLPNDPGKVRSILEMQRKHSDDLLKKHSKNAVNSVPETPKMGAAPGMSPTPMPMGGQGGPSSPMGMQGGMLPDDSPVTPFFVGDHAVIRITNPTNPNSSTIWLVDVKKKVLRPFLSEKAFENAFDDPEEARKAVVTISSKDLGPGGVLDGFTPLKGDKGVKPDGAMDGIEFSPAQLQKRYGKAEDTAGENKSLQILDGVFSKLNQPQQ